MTPLDGRRRSLAGIHLAVALFGFAGLFGKWLALPPVAIVLGRTAFAAAALALLHGLTGRSLRVRAPLDRAGLAACGALLAVHWTTFFRSIQVSTVAVGLLAYSTFPAFTAVLEPLAFRERFRPRSLALGGACLAGVALIVPEFRPTDATFAGVAWGLLSGFTFALLTLVNRGLARRHPGRRIAFWQDLFAAAFLVPAFAAAPSRPSGRDVALLAVLGVVGTAAAHSLFIAGLKRVPARTASVVSALEPVYGIVLALLFLGEAPAARTVAGGLVIVAAVAAASLDGAGAAGGPDRGPGRPGAPA